MASSKPFFVEGMTAEEILSLGDDVLRKLDQRELSRAVRTTALVANKRLKRLMNQAKKTKEGYVEKKSAKHKIALDALNYVTDDGKKKPRFGVGKKSRNELYKELSDIRNFMNLKTSTISGATEVRKQRETRVFKMPREKLIKKQQQEYIKQYKKANKGKKPTLKQLAKIAKATSEQLENQLSDAWKLYRRLLEVKGLPNSPYSKFQGSTELIEMSGQLVMQGKGEQEAIDELVNAFDTYYEEQEAIRQEQLESTLNDTDAFIWESDNPFEF